MLHKIPPPPPSKKLHHQVNIKHTGAKPLQKIAYPANKCNTTKSNAKRKIWRRYLDTYNHINYSSKKQSSSQIHASSILGNLRFFIFPHSTVRVGMTPKKPLWWYFFTCWAYHVNPTSTNNAPQDWANYSRPQAAPLALSRAKSKILLLKQHLNNTLWHNLY